MQTEMEQIDSVLEMLFRAYAEQGRPDPEEICGLFGELDEILDVLTLKEYDSVWDCACKLAIAHERRGFYAGVRMGLRLREELREGDAAPR